MYMYYFLGFQVSGDHGNRQIVEDEKSVKCREAERKDRIKRYKNHERWPRDWENICREGDEFQLRYVQSISHLSLAL